MLHRWEVGQCVTSTRRSEQLACLGVAVLRAQRRLYACHTCRLLQVDRDYRVDGLTVALSEDTDTPTMGNTKIENGSAEIICLLVLDCCGWADVFLPRRLLPI